MAGLIYIVNPACDFPAYFGADVYGASGLRSTVLVADLAITTVAAMVPPAFAVRLCEESVSPVDFDIPADFVCITGKITQWGHMRRIADEFRRRGRTVVIGGPFASLSPDVVRPHCDILVRGEMEEIAGPFFSDLLSGEWKSEYQGTKPDLRTSPVPRWDLYPNDRAVTGSLQTSRGCPFECEFCDVIEYLGRKQRHKPVPQVLTELDVLERHGYRTVLLCDDNLTVYRNRAKELLAGLRDWNARRPGREMQFATQVSIDAAMDDELLALCADAGVHTVFIGIETPNEESLREAKKRQNLKVDLAAQVQRFVDHGIRVIGGMIVGFDHDGPDIFQRQYDFAMSTSVPIFSIGALVAPAATALHQRMQRESRLVEQGNEVAATPWSTNIQPRSMSMEQLMDGLKWLCNRLYDCEAFEHRMVRLIDTYGRARPAALRARGLTAARPVDRESLHLLVGVAKLGPREAAMWHRLQQKLKDRPVVAEQVMGSMLSYLQVRYMYQHGQFWEPLQALAARPEQAAGRVVIPIQPEIQPH